MDEDGLHAQGASNGTSMLSPCPSKACECVRGHIVPLHLCQGPDGAAHGLIRHLDESHGNLGIQHMVLTNMEVWKGVSRHVLWINEDQLGLYYEAAIMLCQG